MDHVVFTHHGCLGCFVFSYCESCWSGCSYVCFYLKACLWLVVLVVKNLSPNTRDLRDVSSIPGQADPLETGMATHSSILVWRIPWTEEPGGLQSIESKRVGHDWSNLACTHTCKGELLRHKNGCGQEHATMRWPIQKVPDTLWVHLRYIQNRDEVSMTKKGMFTPFCRL